MKKIILLIIILSLSSCENYKEELKYDKEGNITSKKYISNKGKLDSVIYYKSNMINKLYFNKGDSNLYFFKSFTLDGKPIAEGNISNKLKDGKWKFYGSNDKVRKIIEFKNICNTEFPNQGWSFDRNGKLDKNLLNYHYTYEFRDKLLKLGGTSEVKIEYTPMNKKDAIYVINFSFEIDSTFCNVKEVEKYSFKSDNAIFQIPLQLEVKGKHSIRGYIEEHVFKDTLNREIFNHISRKVYIDIPLVVN